MAGTRRPALGEGELDRPVTLGRLQKRRERTPLEVRRKAVLDPRQFRQRGEQIDVAHEAVDAACTSGARQDQRYPQLLAIEVLVVPVVAVAAEALAVVGGDRPEDLLVRSTGRHGFVEPGQLAIHEGHLRVVAVVLLEDLGVERRHQELTQGRPSPTRVPTHGFEIGVRHMTARVGLVGVVEVDPEKVALGRVLFLQPLDGRVDGLVRRPRAVDLGRACVEVAETAAQRLEKPHAGEPGGGEALRPEGACDGDSVGPEALAVEPHSVLLRIPGGQERGVRGGGVRARGDGVGEPGSALRQAV